jgi:hypothetical protein
MPKKQTMTIQNLFDSVLREYENLEEGGGWDSNTSNAHWVSGAIFAYAYVLQLLYQMEGVEDERGET